MQEICTKLFKFGLICMLYKISLHRQTVQLGLRKSFLPGTVAEMRAFRSLKRPADERAPHGGG